MDSDMQWSCLWKAVCDMSREIIAKDIAAELLDNEALDENNFSHDTDAILKYVQAVILDHLKDYSLLSGTVF